MSRKTIFDKTFIETPYETAARILAEEQHKPGVTCRVSDDFKVEYVRQDGTKVPTYEQILQEVLNNE